MRPLPNRAHPQCEEHGCRSYEHLVCPAECELLTRPDPDTAGVTETLACPRALLELAPTISIT